jgi:hypothetical protein
MKCKEEEKSQSSKPSAAPKDETVVFIMLDKVHLIE